VERVIIILTGIFLVLVLILVVLSVSIYKFHLIPKPLWSPDLQVNDTKENGDDLQKFASAMLERLDEEKRLKQEQEMMEYAHSKMTDKPLLPSSTNENQGSMTSVRSQSKELVPFNMSDRDRALWEEFNS